MTSQVKDLSKLEDFPAQDTILLLPRMSRHHNTFIFLMDFNLYVYLVFTSLTITIWWKVMPKMLQLPILYQSNSRRCLLVICLKEFVTGDEKVHTTFIFFVPKKFQEDV